jgi:hypothetical protein
VSEYEGKDVEGKKYNPRMFLEGLRKTIKKPQSQQSVSSPRF